MSWKSSSQFQSESWFSVLFNNFQYEFCFVRLYIVRYWLCFISVHLWKAFPEGVREEFVHRSQGNHPLWPPTVRGVFQVPAPWTPKGSIPFYVLSKAHLVLLDYLLNLNDRLHTLCSPGRTGGFPASTSVSVSHKGHTNGNIDVMQFISIYILINITRQYIMSIYTHDILE